MGVSIGVFGGAFDPPHLGHLALARAGVQRFALERLLVRVIAEPGHKAVSTRADVRLELATLAFAGVLHAEVQLDPFARTVDSLAALALEDPVFLVGADEFVSFLTWKDPDRVLELARLGVATRPGFPPERLEAVLSELSRRERVSFFEIEPLAISSSSIRRLASAGKPIDGLVPPAVAAAVERLALYRDAFGRADAG